MGYQLDIICIIPILVAANGILGNLTVFGTAWYTGSVNLTEQIPYISTCGNEGLARCIFSQVCNNGCILALIFEVVVYRMKVTNLAILIEGIISSVGLSITGNFQSSALPSVHYIGAFLAFGFGAAYLFDILFRKEFGCCKIFGFVCWGIYIILLILFIGFDWAKFYNCAAVSEWLAATIFFFVYALFTPEFLKCGSNYKKSAGSDPMTEEMNNKHTARISE